MAESERERLERAVLEKRVMEKRAAEAEPTGGEKAEAALSGFGDSALFGYGPQVQAGTYQAAEEIADALGILPEGFEKETYEETKADFEQRQRDVQGKAPGYALAGTAAGVMVPGTGILKAAQAGGKVMKGARMAKAAQAGKGLEGAKRLKQVGEALKASRGGAKYGAEKTLRGIAGEGKPSQQAKALGTLGAVEGFVADPGEDGGIAERLQSAGVGAVAGYVGLPALHGLASGAKALGRGVSRGMESMGVGALSVFGGVERKYIREVLKNPDVLKNAKSFGEVEDQINKIITPIRKELRDAEISYKEAQDRFREAKKQVLGEVRDENKNISRAFDQEKKRLDFEYRTSVDQLNKVQPPIHLVDNVEESLNKLQRRVSLGSERALDRLRKEADEFIDVQGINDTVMDHLDGLAIDGKIMAADSGIADDLMILYDDITNLGPSLTPDNMKKFIKRLDQRIGSWEREAGTWDDPISLALKDVRQQFDERLKFYPGYAEEMEKVAAHAELLSHARRMFGKKSRAISTMNTIDNPKNVEARDVLSRLGAETQMNYSDDVAEFLNVKNQLKDLKTLEGKERFVKDLDSYEDYAVAEARLAAQKAKTSAQKTAEDAQRISKLEESRRLQIEQQRLKDAKEAAEGVEIFDGMNAAEKMNQLIRILNNGERGGGLALRQQFEKLGAMTDEDFINLVEQMQVVGQFDKTFLRGSRNVNLWTALGYAAQEIGTRSGMGMVTGAVTGGVPGIVMGSVLGATMDIYGPKMTKNILNQVIRIKGIPTPRKIQELSLPPQVKKDLIRQFEVYALTALASQPVKVAQEDIPLVREDIRRNMDMNKLEKAKAINALNRRGEINNINSFIGKPMTIEEITGQKKNLLSADLDPTRGIHRDTGREFPVEQAPLEMMESFIGGPSRAFFEQASQGDVLGGISAAKGAFGRDPQQTPQYEEILEKLGMEQGGKRTAAALGLSLLEPGIPLAGMAKTGKVMLPGMMGSVDDISKGGKVLQFPTEKARARKVDPSKMYQAESTLPLKESTVTKLKTEKQKTLEKLQREQERAAEKAFKEQMKDPEALKATFLDRLFKDNIQGVEKRGNTLIITSEQPNVFAKNSYSLDKMPGVSSIHIKAPNQPVSVKLKASGRGYDVSKGSKEFKAPVIEAGSRFKALGERPAVEGGDIIDLKSGRGLEINPKNPGVLQYKSVPDKAEELFQSAIKRDAEILSEPEQQLGQLIKFPGKKKRGRKKTTGEDAEMFSIKTGRPVVARNPEAQLLDEMGPLDFISSKQAQVKNKAFNKSEDDLLEIIRERRIKKEMADEFQPGTKSQDYSEHGLTPIPDHKEAALEFNKINRSNKTYGRTPGGKLVKADYKQLDSTKTMGSLYADGINDILPMFDSKHQVMKNVMKAAKQPMDIITGNDLIARDDYLKLIPEKSKVTFPVVGDEGLERVLYEGRASEKRLMKAANRLKSERPDLKVKIHKLSNDEMEMLFQGRMDREMRKAESQLAKYMKKHQLENQTDVADILDDISLSKSADDFADDLVPFIPDKKQRDGVAYFLEWVQDAKLQQHLVGDVNMKTLIKMDSKALRNAYASKAGKNAQKAAESAWDDVDFSIGQYAEGNPQLKDAILERLHNEASTEEEAYSILKQMNIGDQWADSISSAWKKYIESMQDDFF